MVVLNAIETASPVTFSVRKGRLLGKDPTKSFHPIMGAELTLYENQYYYKGNDTVVSEGLKSRGETLSEKIETQDIRFSELPKLFEYVVKRLMYTSLRLKLEARGYTRLQRIKKDRPDPFTTTDMVLPEAVSVEPLIYRSCELRLDPRYDDRMFLWFGIRSHLAVQDSPDLHGRLLLNRGGQRLRILTKREKDVLGLTDQFLRASALSPKNYLETVSAVVKDLCTPEPSKASIEFSDGYQLRFFPELVKLDAGQSSMQPSSGIVVLQNPVVRFGQGSYTSAFTGLLNDVPQKLISDKRLAKILVLYEKKDDLYVKDFCTKLKDGTARWRGFLRTFGINLEFVFKQYSFSQTSEFTVGVSEAMRLESGHDLVLIVGRDELIDAKYYELKRMVWQRRELSQLVETENTVKKIIRGDIYTIMNLATGLYVKLGGVPWLLEREPVRDCLGYIGLGFTKSATGTGINYGVAYIFDKRGYTVDVAVESFAAPDSSFNAVTGLFLPKDRMQNVLKAAIRKLKSSPTAEIDQNARIIVHKSAPIHEEETLAAREIEAAENVKVVLVHVESENPYRAFQDIGGVASSALRGTYYHIDSHRGIIWTAGSRDGRGDAKIHGALEINVEPREKVVNARSASEQVYGLTMMTWRSGNIKMMPVTIEYAREAARLIKNGIEINAQNWSLVI